MRKTKLSVKNQDDETFGSSYRIIDVNINRCKEGLRVCEEIARFNLKDDSLTKKFANIRHKLTSLIKKSTLKQELLYRLRDIRADFGKTYVLGPKRKGFCQIFLANTQRAKESLRVLEEFLKLFDKTTSKKIQSLRFKVYEIEKKSVERFPTILDIR